jgi:hypothetical protein
LAETYRKTRLPATRLLAMETMKMGVKAHYVSGFLEVDVTEARRIINEAKSIGIHISFTGWLMKCLASAVKEFPEINAYRKGRTLYIFETVNIATMVERELRGEPVPLPYLVKDCGTKSVLDISREIASVKEGDVGEDLVIADKQAARIAKLAVWSPRVSHLCKESREEARDDGHHRRHRRRDVRQVGRLAAAHPERAPARGRRGRHIP